jgi:hypothetical protein
MVANAPAYVFRMWGPILNKLLYATDAGLRPMLWIGDLPRALRAPESHSVWKSKFYVAFVLNRRVDFHAIEATPARWRGDAGSSPNDRARTAASSPRISAPDTLVDFHTGRTACSRARFSPTARRYNCETESSRRGAPTRCTVLALQVSTTATCPRPASARTTTSRCPRRSLL